MSNDPYAIDCETCGAKAGSPCEPEDRLFAYEITFQTRVESDTELTPDEIYDRAAANVATAECDFVYDEEDVDE